MRKRVKLFQALIVPAQTVVTSQWVHSESAEKTLFHLMDANIKTHEAIEKEVTIEWSHDSHIATAEEPCAFFTYPKAMYFRVRYTNLELDDDAIVTAEVLLIRDDVPEPFNPFETE